MKKYAYLARLEALLADLPEQEREDALTYYEEYIDAAGKEQEAQTIAALGSPEEVAQKILEGEGLTAEMPASTDAPQPPADAAPAANPAAAAGAAPSGDPQNSGPQSAPQPPAAPEPPAAFAADEPAPAAYTPGSGAGGFHPFQNPPKPFSRRGWVIFVCVIAAALIVQLAFLVIHFAGSGRGTRQVTAVDTATSHAPVVMGDSGDHDLFEGDDYDDFDDHAEHVDRGTAAAAEAPADYADGTVSLYDTDVQEVELHITSADLYIQYDASAPDEVHLEIAGLDADQFETSYRTDDERRKLVVRDGRKVSAATPAEETTVTLTLPQNFREVEANVVTGNIVLGGLSLGDVELKTSTGDIITDALTVGKLDLKTNTGNITVGLVTPGAGEHEVDLKTGTGNITAALKEVQSAYEYELKARKGTVQVNGQTVNSSAQSRSGRYELEASADTGDVSVTFAG